MRSLICQLHVGTACASRRGSKTDLGDNLIWFQCSLECSDEEVIGLDGAFAIGTLDHDVRLEGQYNGGYITGGVGVGDASTNSTTIAHLLISNLSSCFSQGCKMLMEATRTSKRGIRRHC